MRYTLQSESIKRESWGKGADERAKLALILAFANTWISLFIRVDSKPSSRWN